MRFKNYLITTSLVCASLFVSANAENSQAVSQTVATPAAKAAGSTSSSQNNSAEVAVAKKLQEKFPKLKNITVAKVTDKGVKDIYMVTINGRVAYTTSDVGFIFTNGNLISAETADNLTSFHQQASNVKLFAGLPKENAFKTVFGKGERVLITVEDADCPACKEFNRALHTYTKPEKLNLTLYTFPFALERLHPEAAAKADKIWCSSDTAAGRASAWKAWMVDNKMPTANIKGCKSPIKANLEAFSTLGINATPTLLFPDGSATPGGIDPERLAAALDTIPAKK